MKVCVIGTGRMGVRHIEALLGLDFEIVGIHDLLRPAMLDTARKYNIPEKICFDNFEDMLFSQRPEAVVIASTAPAHAHQVIESAKSGARIILCEKPMATSISECNQMISACEANNSVLAINHQRRFLDLYKKVYELSGTEDLGGLRSITVTASNFGLAMNASHVLEMFMYMSREPINEIQFWADRELVPNPRGSQYEDHSGQIRATTKSGKRLFIELGGDLGHGINTIYSCRYGQIWTDDLKGIVRVNTRKQEHRDLPTTRYGMPSEEAEYKFSPADLVTSTQELWKSILNKGSFPDAQTAKAVVSALIAANISAENLGRPVMVSEVMTKDNKYNWA